MIQYTIFLIVVLVEFIIVVNHLKQQDVAQAQLQVVQIVGKIVMDMVNHNQVVLQIL